MLAALLVAGCGDNDADKVFIDARNVTTFDVTLTTSQETPPCPAAGPDATGTATISVTDNNEIIEVRQLTFSGLSGPATTADIHQGARGVAGPIIFPLDVNTVPFMAVGFNSGDYPTPAPEGAAPDFPSFVEALRVGDTYIDVHTAACPDGEIRAQIQ
ncbi:MAG: CHRD domain-containing protein [Kofleriaceae bacterium]|nr:CHRD domain-containing protein [Kofleriaceae bacterium]